MPRGSKSTRPKLPQPDKIQLHLRLPRELAERFQASADDQGISDTELFTRATSEYLQRHSLTSVPPARLVAGGATDAVIEGLIIQARTVEQTHKLLSEMNVGLLAELAERKTEIAALRKDLAMALASRTKEIKDHAAAMITSLVEPMEADIGAIQKEIEKGGQQASALDPTKPSASDVQQKPKPQTQASQPGLVNPLQGRAIPGSRSSTAPTGGNLTRR